MKYNNEIMAKLHEYEIELRDRFHKIDEVAQYNQYKVLSAMQNNKLSERHFSMSTGYGYNDEGRDLCEVIFAEVFGGEMAIVRPQIVSGTHAISLCLYATLRPNDEMLAITGDPYDTIKATIGLTKDEDGHGSLLDYNITYSSCELTDDGDIDFEAVKNAINERTKLIYIQRSTGYSDRKAITVETIMEAVIKIRQMKENLIIVVDNCYGEFLEKIEPTNVGVDLIAGSMIKNPGGGLAHTGGYVIGGEKYIKMVASRLTAPGIAFEVGSNFNVIRSYLQGLFIAPKVTADALKGSILTAKAFSDMGYRVYPSVNDERSDIIQAIVLEDREKVIRYCHAIQKASPVDSYVVPEPWAMPGYDSDIIMAAGNFIQGSSIELSADSPLKPPYIVFQQGGLTYEHSKLGLMSAIDAISNI